MMQLWFDRIRIPSLLLFAVWVCGGCVGYRLGPIQRVGINSIAVDAVKNLTDEPRLGVTAAAKLRNRLVADGSLDLVDRNAADAILKVRVLSYKTGSAGSARLTSIDQDQDTYTTVVWRITVKVEYRLIRPGDKDPVIPRRIVTGSAEISDLYDVETARQDGFEQALHAAAKNIVIGITEDW